MMILSDELVERANLGRAPFPADWVSRRLFVGDAWARNFLAAASEPSYVEHAHAAYGLRALCREAVARVRAGTMVSFGPGDGAFDAELVQLLGEDVPELLYIPVDISRHLLVAAMRRVGRVGRVPVGVLADIEGGGPSLREALDRFARRPILFALLGCTVANLDLGEPHFFASLGALMQPGDSFLLDVPLYGPGWTAEDDPRLRSSEYPDSLKLFLAGGLVSHEPGLSLEDCTRWFDERIECVVGGGGAVEGTKLFVVRDRLTHRPLLRIGLYAWDSVVDWLRGEGFDVAYAECSLSSPEDKLGMGVVLLTRHPGTTGDGSRSGLEGPGRRDPGGGAPPREPRAPAGPAT